MSDEKTFTQADLDAAVASAAEKAVAAANARTSGITRIAAGFGLDATATAAAVAGTLTVEAFALEQADAAKIRRAAGGAHAAKAYPVRTDADPNSVDAVVARINAA